VTPRATPRAAGYAALTVLALVAALAFRRAELVACAVPFALVLGAGLGRSTPDVRVHVSVGAEHVLEGATVPVTVEVSTERPVDRVEVALRLPPGAEPEGDELPVALHLGWDDTREITTGIRATWGSWAIGDVRVRARDRFGLVTWEQRVDRTRLLRAYPRPEELRRLVAPARTQAALGSEQARTRGEGLEFADTRPFVPGDRLRSVNWRASARLGELIVDQRHPDRNADVVLFLDSFSDAGPGGRGLVGPAVRAAATLAELYLRRRDRVGLVAFGGTLRWLEPAGGLIQHYRLVDALLETRVRFSYAWKDVNVIPARTLPPRALIVALTPLLDLRAIGALLDLRARGHDLAVIEVAADRWAEPGEHPSDDLARRIWDLRRAAVRARLQSLGVAVATWDDSAPLDPHLEGVRSFRRHARLALR
jgi:uncharacterized protein (DUF58 family)